MLPASWASVAVAPTESVRSFVAIELPKEHRAALAAFTARWRAPDDGVRWVAAENLHLTLWFLGEVLRPGLEAVQLALQEAVAALPAFALRLEQPGAFPPRGAPRVLWIGLEGDLSALRALYGAVERTLIGLGFASDSNSFSPHITLGRVRTPRGPSALPPVPELTETPPISVEAISLMASKLTPQGSIYSRLALLPLAPRPISKATSSVVN